MSYMEDFADIRDEPRYKLSLDGDGITLNREITREIALAVINVALGGTAAAPPALATPAAQPSGQDAAAHAGTAVSDTPGEYVEAVGARTNVDKIIAFGAYLRDDRGQQQFTREDIKGMFRAAHETPPANYPRDFRAALASRGIAEESTDRYFVTRTGRTMIEQGFAAPRASRRGRRQGAASADTEA